MLRAGAAVPERFLATGRKVSSPRVQLEDECLWLGQCPIYPRPQESERPEDKSTLHGG